METVFQLARLISTKPFATLCVGLIAFFHPNKKPTLQLNLKVPVKISVAKTYPLQVLNDCIIQQMVQDTEVNILLIIFSLLM